jgi:hypothetical protein
MSEWIVAESDVFGKGMQCMNQRSTSGVRHSKGGRASRE